MKIYDPDQYYRYGFFTEGWVCTAGVMNLAEEKSCYWLLDMVASYSASPMLKAADYLKIIKLELKAGKTGAVFTIEDEINGVLIKQEIEFTDLQESLKFWAITEGSRTVVLLPEEY